MATSQDRTAQRSQKHFEQAGSTLQAQMAGLGAKFNQLRDAAGEKLPFLARRPADPSQQRFLCSGVRVQGVQGPLQHLAQQAVRLQPGQECSVQEVKETAAAVFGTGFFSSCGTKANDTPDGTEIVIEVEANPVLRGVQLKGSTELPDRVVGEAFRGQEGGVINFARFSGALKQINGWYQEHGVFGQITHAGLNKDNVAELTMEEMPVESVLLAFSDRETRKPMPKGKTRPHVLFRELSMRPGKVFRLDHAAQDVERLYATGLFEYVDVLPRASALEGTQRSVEVVLNAVERKALNASGGVGMQPGEGLDSVLGNASVSHNNLWGCNHALDFAVDAGQTNRTFRLAYKDPWVGTGRQRVSLTGSAARTTYMADAVYGCRQPGHAQTQAEQGSDEPDHAEHDQPPVVSRLASGLRVGTSARPWWKLGGAVSCERTQLLGAGGEPCTRVRTCFR